MGFFCAKNQNPHELTGIDAVGTHPSDQALTLLYLAQSQSEVFLNGKKAQVVTVRGIAH